MSDEERSLQHTGSLQTMEEENSLYSGVRDSEVLDLFFQDCPILADTLLGWIVNYMRTRTDAPYVFHVGAGLALLSALAPANLRYQDFGGLKYPAIWTLLLGRSTEERKSTCIQIAERMLLDTAPERHAGSPPGSAEALEDYLQEFPVTALIHDEYSAFLSRTAKPMYSDIRMVMAAAYDGRVRGRRLVDSAAGVRPVDARVTFLGGLSLGYFDEIISETDTRSGFFARHSMLIGRRTGLDRVWSPPEPGLLKGLLAALKEFNALPLSPESYCCGFTPEALEIWTQFTEVCSTLRAGRSDALKAAAARGKEFAQRAAVLLAVTMGSYLPNEPWQLDAIPTAAGVALGFWVIRSASQVLENLADSPFRRNKRRLIEFFLTHGSNLTRPQVYSLMNIPGREIEVIIQNLMVEERLSIPSTQDGVIRYMLKPAPEGMSLSRESIERACGIRLATPRDQAPWPGLLPAPQGNRGAK